jgi:hypothetical protein
MKAKQALLTLQQAFTVADAYGKSKTLYISDIGNFEITVKPVYNIHKQTKEVVKGKLIWVDESSELSAETWDYLKTLV